MKPYPIYKYSFVCLIGITLPVLSYGQFKLAKKYVDDRINSLTYLKFNTDKTFEYRYAYDLMHDFATGSFRLSKDTIFLTYNKDSTNVEEILGTRIDVLRADSSGFKATRAFCSF